MKIACFVEAYNFKDKSESAALSKFKSTAELMGHKFEFIFKDDISDISSIQKYDALFIRATTDPNNSAYLYSRLAEQAGLKVIDDPNSIRICSNKAILHDLFLKHNIPAPKSILFFGDYSRENLAYIFKNLGSPIVNKTPYTKFSSQVEKSGN